MTAITIGETADWFHRPLVQRIAAIAETLFRPGSVELRDIADRRPAGSSARIVLLERGDTHRLRRDGERLATVTYSDPASETTLAQVLAAMAAPHDPLAADPESLSVFALADRLASSEIPVLIGGPTGTGKEVLSRFIHARSNRRDGPFVAVNCAAMPEAMLEAMLFGHEKGSYTGATQAGEGFMRAANGGTLLLDEIAEMPLALQAKLLRALQEREVVPIGSTRPIKVDIRIIAAANRDLPLEVAEGRFRADLFYRLNVFPLSLRPLRERAEDIAPLAFALALRHSPLGTDAPCFTEAAIAMLKLHGWPGNVRELENVVRRALLLCNGKGAIEPCHIVFDSPARLVRPVVHSVIQPVIQSAPALPSAPAEAEATPGGKLSSIVQLSEARAIIDTLEACGGNRGRAARELGISERTLRYRLASFREAGIEVARAAAGGRR